MGLLTPNILLEAALQYAARSWKILPLVPRTKRPAIRGWRSKATSDPDQIERWWAARPDYNVGLATGESRLVALDPDGPEGLAELRRLVGLHGPLPRTLASRTPGGHHLMFRGSGVRSTARGDLHVRGEGGLVALPPSIHPSGKQYAWVDATQPIADLPAWVGAWRASLGGRVETGPDLGALPAHLAGIERRTRVPAEPWSAHGEARIRGALASIPVKGCGYQTFLEIGMALQSLGWQRSDGTEINFDIWNDWCAASEHHNLAGLEQKWQSFTRSGIGIGTIFHLAEERGWRGEVEIEQKPVTVKQDGYFLRPSWRQQEIEVMQNSSARTGSNDPVAGGLFADPTAVGGAPAGEPAASGAMNGAHALPAELATAPAAGIVFPDVTQKGKPAGTRHNAMLAICGLGIECKEDTFHEAFVVGGHSLGRLVGEISDKAIHQLRDLIRRVFGFEPGAQNVRDAAETLCVQNPFDPVLDYLDCLRWDGVRRIDTWMADYLGAPRDEWSAAVGRLMLVAAVRRARQPGAKWDHVVVWEGPQGTGKSHVLETLAGEENFSDMRILGRSEERQHEAVRGVWIYEIAELAGMKRAEVEHIKAFVTRKKESTRTAYAHYKTHDRRRCIFVATTNELHYLKDDTGNRRFLPIRTGVINWDAVARDRDQLWAEAVEAERGYGPLVLPYDVRSRASAEQESRLVLDDWRDVIERWIGDKVETSIGETAVGALHMQVREIDQICSTRTGRILRQLGFTQYRKRDGESLSWRFRR
jgi:hypothetical protein